MRLWLFALLTGCGARSGLSIPDVEAARNYIAVAAGSQHSCVLADDGSLTCFGPGPPHVVQGLPPLRAIAAHGRETCGIARDGRVLCLEAGERRELAGVAGIALGGAALCGWWSDGRARCLAQTSSTPKEIADIDTIADVAQIAVGEMHVCARTFSGDVHCRGSSWVGVLGNGADGVVLPNIVAFTEARDVASAPFSACAVSATGSVACWGYDGLGALAGYGRDRCNVASIGLLGDGRCALRAVRIDALRDVVSIVSGGDVVYSGSPFIEDSAATCAVLRDRSLRCFGHRTSALGFPPTCSAPCAEAPAEPVGLGAVRSVAIGSYHACAIGTDGRVRCWGSGADGQLGVALRESVTPVVVPLP